MSRRPDRLSGVKLAVVPTARGCFDEPEDALETLTQDLQELWDDHRTDEMAERRIGSLQLTSGAYLQWIGYRDALVVECSSNAYLDGPARLTPREELTLRRAGFSAPDDRDPNFWLAVEDRSACGPAAFSVVAVLTAVFGVYAG